MLFDEALDHLDNTKVVSFLYTNFRKYELFFFQARSSIHEQEFQLYRVNL